MTYTLASHCFFFFPRERIKHHIGLCWNIGVNLSHKFKVRFTKLDYSCPLVPFANVNQKPTITFIILIPYYTWGTILSLWNIKFRLCSPFSLSSQWIRRDRHINKYIILWWIVLGPVLGNLFCIFIAKILSRDSTRGKEIITLEYWLFWNLI